MSARLRTMWCALLLSTLALPARAEVAWVRSEGAEGCIDEQELESALVRQGLPESTLAARRIEGVLEPHAGGFRARLRVRGADGALGPARNVESAATDCRALDASIVLVAAMLASEGEHVAMPAAPPIPAPRRLTRFELGALLGVNVGLLPSPGITPQFSFRFASPMRVGFQLGFQASLDFDGTHYYAGNSQSLLLNTFQFPVAVCVDALRSERFLIVPCGGALLGAFIADIDDDRSQRDLLAVATLGVRLGWSVTRSMRILLDLNGGALLKGPVYRYGYPDMGVRYEDVFKPARFQVHPALGLARTF